MKKQWVPILILVWLVLLTVCMVLFQMRTGVVDEILDEQDRQAGILIKQSEILALNAEDRPALLRFPSGDRHPECVIKEHLRKGVSL